ncbi:lipopolysaccharide biosynthesis protein [Thioalkalivibrio versutus]|uniref:lipopolysaccharide biosynthesis protein n=1 Tax=Thioalkalivibrio versutus TaxID=106634 RepID=UPI00036ACDAE|nr:lipopolysaccharide biosynthesis protein [Thioalkalivibrio versutus]OOC48226.1 polysaccharide biosynthesis protein [Thioalkalivibrio versutus]
MSSAFGVPRRAFRRVWRSRFARNVVVVASGTAGAQAITVAFAPLITRIYGPEAFGLLGTFMAIVTVAIPVAALAYPIAIVLPRDERDALGLVRLSAILSFGVALLAAAALWAGGDWLTATLGTEAVAGFLLLVPVAMLFAAWMQIAQQWLIRKKEFSVVARSAVAHSFVLNSAMSGIGWLHPLGAVLIVLATLGQALHAGLLFIGIRRRHRDQGSAAAREERPGLPLKELVYRYRDFPLYRAPQNFINAASQSLPVLMLAAFFGPAAAGFYTLGKMVMGMPSNLLGKAVTDVFYPRITEAAHNGENLPQHIVRATGVLLAIGIVPFGLVVLLGPWLFSVAFGSDWAIAGEYARWLALFFLFNFINKPSVAAVPVLGIQRGLLIYEMFSTGGKALGLFVGFYCFGSDLWAVALFSVIGVIAYSVMMLWILSHAMR